MATITGTGAADTLAGTASADQFFALAGNDTINAGNLDTVDGGGGSDTLILVDEVPGARTTVAASKVEHILATNDFDIVNLRSAINGDVNLGAGSDTLNLGNFKSTVTVSKVETIQADLGAQTVSALTPIHNVDLGRGHDVLHTDNFGSQRFTASHVEEIVGGSGIEQLTIGAAGTIDLIDLGARNDTLDLKAFQVSAFVKNVESITASATSGNQDITFGTSATGVSIDLGGGTSDTVFLGNFDNNATVHNVEFTFGGTGNDTINYFGTAPLADIEGRGGNDILIGHGDDFGLVGGAGIDQLTGGIGANAFVFRDGDAVGTAGTADLITDFQDGVDHIDLFEYGLVGGTDTFTFQLLPEDSTLDGSTQQVTTHFDAANNVTQILINLGTGTSGFDEIVEMAGEHHLTGNDFVL